MRPVGSESNGGQRVAAFSFESIAAHLSGDLRNGVNACVECCDRHVAPGRVALEWEARTDAAPPIHLNKCAIFRRVSRTTWNYLQSRGVGPGDVVAGLLPRTPELLVTILGTWRAGAVYQPLFTAFGSKAIEHRLQSSEAKLVVTDTVN